MGRATYGNIATQWSHERTRISPYRVNGRKRNSHDKSVFRAERLPLPMFSYHVEAFDAFQETLLCRNFPLPCRHTSSIRSASSHRDEKEAFTPSTEDLFPPFIEDGDTVANLLIAAYAVHANPHSSPIKKGSL